MTILTPTLKFFLEQSITPAITNVIEKIKAPKNSPRAN